MLFKLEIFVDSVCVNVNKQQLTDAFADICYVQICSFVAVHHALNLHIKPDHTETDSTIIHSVPKTVEPQF